MSIEKDRTKNRTAMVKVSSDLLTIKDQKTNERRHNYRNFRCIGNSALTLSATHNIVIVTSGAIAAGMTVTGQTEKPDKKNAMPELQRLAGIGNRFINNRWQEAVGHDQIMGNILATRSELKVNSAERKELSKVVKAHFFHGDFITVNEDDARSHEEISFGDNDILTALMGVMISEDEKFGEVDVVLLGTVDGLLEDLDDPESVIRTVNDLDEVRRFAVDSRGTDTNGGIQSKFDAAEILGSAGIDMRIANGNIESAAELALANKIGTHFVVQAQTLS